MRAPASGCVLVLLIAGVAPARAQDRDPAAAEALFREGRRDMERRDPAAACRKFAESQRLDPAPGTRLNLAECEEAQGHLASAWTQLRAALEQLPAGDPRRALAERRVQALERRLPRLTVRLPPDPPAGARVRRDQIELGHASLAIALPVDPGRHVVTLEAPGHAIGRVEISLREGEQREVLAVVGASVPLVATPAVVAPAAVDRRPSAPPPSRQEGTSSRRLAFYATGGLASATAVGVIVTGALWLGKRGTVEDECPGKRCTDKGLEAVDGARTLGTVNVVLWAATLAAGGTAAWLWYGDREATTAAAVPLPGGVAVAVQGRF